MYVLFIPSFPNNRFRLGNIRTKKTKKTKGEKREKEEEANVESLRYKLCGNFVTFFVLYFMNNCEMSLSSGLLLHFHFCFLFFFFLFLFLVQTIESRTFETGNGSDLRYSLFYCFLIAKKHVARLAGSFFLGHVLFPFPFFEL